MTSIQSAINEFLLDQNVRLNAEKTIKNYQEIVGAWARYVGEAQPIESISKHDMRLYVLHLRGKELSRESIRSYIRSLRVFWKFVSKEYGIENAMETIKEPRKEPYKPRGVKESDFIKLFNAIDDETEVGIRDRAILCLFADTGARLGGIASLEIEAIDTIRRKGVVMEKGHQEHMIYWTHFTNQLICNWLSVRPYSESPQLFVTMREGREATGLTKSGIYQILKRLKKKAEVTGKANPHSFRHNFARQYLLSGGDVITLAKILNHKDVNMTAEYYAIFDDRELGQLQAEHSPLLKMLGIER